MNRERKYLTIGDVANVSAGNSAPQKKELFENGVFPFVRTSDVGKIRVGSIDDSADKLNDEGIKKLKLYPEGTILIPKSGASTFLNHRVILAAEAYVSSHLATINAKNEIILDRYLLFFLITIKAQDLIQDHAYPSLKLSDIQSIPVFVPSIPEQKRIVAILEETFAGIDKAIANTQQNLANARELFESYLNTIFTQKGEGWVNKKLEDVCYITSKLIDPREPKYIDMPHLGAGNMVSMTGELVNIQTAREEGLKSGKFLFDKTMVLYSKIRPYLMKSCRPDFSGLCSADVYPLSPDDEWLDRDFLFHLLMSRHFTDYAISGSDRAGMPKVNRDHLFRYRVYLPDVFQQKKIAKKLDEVFEEAKRLEKIYQQKLVALAELKQSLLQKAFSGELTADELPIKKEAVA